jgi:4-aminobutyrate aminotransferase-like enzyme
MINSDLLTRRERALGKRATLLYRQPLQIVRGEGVYLFDDAGKRYMDLYNNVPCVGHANPHVVAAMVKQASTLNVHSRYLHESIVRYAERLSAHHDKSLTTTVFTCTGTEANEVAMMMARCATGGRGIVCTDAGYHGNSEEVRKLNRTSVGGKGEIRSIPFPQTFRPIREGVSETELTELYLAEVRRVIREFAEDGIGFAGMLVCPILANEGLPNIPAGFMPRAAEVVREAGGLFIADEVQAGLCRSGRWWGYEVTGFVPDIVSMGKPLGNGLPLAGVIAREELVNEFRAATKYFNTFASSPLQGEVGNAVLDVLEKERLCENSVDVGAYLRGQLSSLTARYDAIAEVRGHGLFVGLEWVSDRVAKTPDRRGAEEAANRLKDKGFLVYTAGAFSNILKIRPPLVFFREHADAFVSALDEVLQDMYGHS